MRRGLSLLLCALVVLSLTACTQTAPAQTPVPAETAAPAETPAPAETAEPKPSPAVADASQMTTVEEVVEERMTPV